jgi:hypothetical protein
VDAFRVRDEEPFAVEGERRAIRRSHPLTPVEATLWTIQRWAMT